MDDINIDLSDLTGNVLMGSGTDIGGVYTISVDPSTYGYSYSNMNSGWTLGGGTINIADTKPRVEIREGDIIMDGVSLKETLEGIQDRLSILQPRPELLEKYEALKQAYEHYKTLEALVKDEINPDTK